MMRIRIFGFLSIVIAVAVTLSLLHDTSVVKVKNAYVTGNLLHVTTPFDSYVNTVYVQEGQRVAVGDILYTIDKTEKELELNAAINNLETSIRDEVVQCVEFQVYKNSYEIGQLQHKQRRLHLEKREHLAEKKILPIEEIQNAELQEQEAGKKRDISKLNYHLAGYENDKPILERTSVKDNIIKLKRIHHSLSLHTVRATRSGYVYAVRVFDGQYVSQGSLATIIVPDGDIRIEANVLESKLEKIQPGQRVSVALDIYGKSRRENGVVDSIVPATSAAFSPIPRNNIDSNWIKVSQRVPVLIKLDNLTNGIYPLGSSVEVEIDLSPAKLRRSMAQSNIKGDEEVPKWMVDVESIVNDTYWRAVGKTADLDLKNCQAAENTQPYRLTQSD